MPDPNEIQRLLPRHHAILELALAGHKARDIAQAVDMTPEGVGLIMRAPLFQDALARRRKEQSIRVDEAKAEDSQRARGVLEQAAVAAAETQVALLQAEKEDVKLRASNSILDRIIGPASAQAKGPVVMINAETVQLLQLAIAESAKSAGSENA